MKRTIVLIALAVFAMIISACSPSDDATPTVASPPTLIPATLGSEPTTSELNGTSWTLTSLNGAAPVQGTNVTLTFSDSQVGGTPVTATVVITRPVPEPSRYKICRIL